MVDLGPPSMGATSSSSSTPNGVSSPNYFYPSQTILNASPPPLEDQLSLAKLLSLLRKNTPPGEEPILEQASRILFLGKRKHKATSSPLLAGGGGGGGGGGKLVASSSSSSFLGPGPGLNGKDAVGSLLTATPPQPLRPKTVIMTLSKPQMLNLLQSKSKHGPTKAQSESAVDTFYIFKK